MKTVLVYVIITMKYYGYQTAARFKVGFPFFILFNRNKYVLYIILWKTFLHSQLVA